MTSAGPVHREWRIIVPMMRIPWCHFILYFRSFTVLEQQLFFINDALDLKASVFAFFGFIYFIFTICILTVLEFVFKLCFFFFFFKSLHPTKKKGGGLLCAFVLGRNIGLVMTWMLWFVWSFISIVLYWCLFVWYWAGTGVQEMRESVQQRIQGVFYGDKGICINMVLR